MCVTVAANPVGWAGTVAGGVTVVYATVQSSEPSELVARIVIVPEPVAVEAPLMTRDEVLNETPAGSDPTTA